jgi:hypothetical protein
MHRLFANRGLALATSVAMAGCYGWDIGSAPLDAASSREAGHADAAMHQHDAGVDVLVRRDAGPADATKPEEASSPPCAMLAANVDAARVLAQACTTVGSSTECTTYVTDSCGCQQFVDTPGASAQSYAAAVASFQEAGCPPATCAGCPARLVTGECLDMTTGSTVMTACSP